MHREDLRVRLPDLLRRLGAQEAFEPTGDATESLDAPVRPPAAREIVRLFGIAHHLDRLAEEAHGTEELFGLRDRAAQVHLAAAEKQRSLHVLHVTDRGSSPQLVEVGVWRRAELEGAPQHDVVLRILADEVGDGAHRDRGREAVGLTDHPVGHVAAIRAAADAHAAHVDAAASLDRLVESRHQVDVVLAAPVANDLAPEVLAVSVRAAWVDVQDHVAHSGEDLELVHERRSVLPMRSTVNLEHEGIYAVGIEVGRPEHPALDDPAVRGGERFALRLRHVSVAQPRVQVGHLRLRALGEHVQLAGVGRVRGAEGDDAGRDVEVVDAALAGDLGPHVALEVARIHGARAGSAGREVDAIAFRRPHHARAVARAHVGDEAVADRLIEADGEASLVAATSRHDPQALQQARVEPVGGDERDHVAARRPRRRAEIEPAHQLGTPGREVDHVEVEGPLQVGVGLRVARHDELFAVRRPVEPGHVPGSARQLCNVATGRRHYEQMVVAAVDEALAVVLVVEAACDPGDRGASQLIPAIGWPGVVHDRVGIAQHRADESDLSSIARPQRAPGALGQRRQLAGVTRARHVQHEDLVDRAAAAHEGHPAAVGGPLGRMISPRTGGGVHRLCLEQAPDDDAASILARLGVRPAQLVRHSLAVRAEPDVVDPAKPIKVFWDDRSGHPVSRFKQQKQLLCAPASFLPPYLQSVLQPR